MGMVLRSLVNKLGMAWWARVETNDPNVIYWFGPFLTRTSLRPNLKGFIEDLSFEGNRISNQTIVRCRRVEPLTINF